RSWSPALGRKPEHEGLDAAHQAGRDAEADQRPCEDQRLERLRVRERDATGSREHQQGTIDAPRPEAVEQQSERNLEQTEREEINPGEEAELGRAEAEFLRERRPEHGIHRAKYVRQVIAC